jgi:hypothetical protein
MRRKSAINILIMLIIYMGVPAADFYSPVAQTQGQSENTNEAITDAQLEKLKLEIQELKNKSSFANTIPQYIPLMTTLIAVAGFCFTIYQFFAAQNKDRLAKEHEQKLNDEDQIRTNVEQLLSLNPKEEESIGRVFFLLQDLNTLTLRNPTEKPKITNSLVEFIRNDCDFDNLRHIRIDIAALQHWPDYSTYLSKNRSSHNFIIYKYFQALRHVHDEDTDYFESIKYEKDYGFRVERFTQESLYLRFLSLISGYELHLRILKENAGEVREVIDRFSKAVNNPILTKQLVDSGRFPFVP